MSINGAILETYGDGMAYGLMYNTNASGVLSSFWSAGGEEFQGWIFNASILSTLTFACRNGLCQYRIHMLPFVGAPVVTDSINGNATIAAIPIGEFYLWIEVLDAGNAAFGIANQIAISVAVGAVSSQPNVFNLTGLVPSLYTDFAAKNVNIRVNSGALVLTNCENQFQQSGSILIGRVSTSNAPLSSWNAFLFQQRKHYLGKWKLGGFMPLFGTTTDGGYRDIHNYPLNVFALPNGLLNMAIINSTLYSASSTLQCQVKYSQWVDFTTADQTYSKITPSYLVLWPKIIALANLHTIPTDNPDHLDFMRKIKEAVKFLVLSPDPKAQQLRGFLKSFGTAALKAAPELAEMAASMF
jgi:hypothetical protein